MGANTPNHLQHYATSATNQQQNSTPHLVKIIRPSSRDPMANGIGRNTQSAQGLPQVSNNANLQTQNQLTAQQQQQI